MAVPTYDKLLERCKVTEGSINMEKPVDDDHLKEVASKLDEWELLAKYLNIPNSQIEDLKSHRTGVQRIRMFECWKQRCGSMATYKAMVVALLQINRTDLAEKVITLRYTNSSAITTYQTQSSLNETSPAMPSSPTSSSEIEDMSPSATMSPLLQLPLAIPGTHTKQKEEVKSILGELEEDFFKLVNFAEDSLRNSEVCLETMLRRFRMLPCLLYTSPSPRDATLSHMPSSA